MRLRVRDLVELPAELPDGLGATVDRDAVPEEGVVVGHLLPTATAEDASLPLGSGRPSLRRGHGSSISPGRVDRLRRAGFTPGAPRDARALSRAPRRPPAGSGPGRAPRAPPMRCPRRRLRAAPPSQAGVAPRRRGGGR